MILDAHTFCRQCSEEVAQIRLGAFGYCPPCWRLITNPIRDRLGMPSHGRGRLLAGSTLECDTCGYQWVGTVGERCARCPEVAARWRTQQAALVLRSPGDSPDAWAGRLARAVESGLITEAQARAAWGREVARDAA